MSFKPGAVILHGAASSVMIYGYQSLGSLVTDTWIKTQRGGHFQYLTIQGLAIALFTMVFSLAADFYPSFIAFHRIKRALFMIAMPVAIVVSSIYWTILVLAPALILQSFPPDTLPTSSNLNEVTLIRIPFLVDLALHATPVFSLLADFVLFEQKYGEKEVRYGAPSLIALTSVWYGCWVEYCASFNGSFPYPFLTENPLEIRVIIYGCSACLALVSFWGVNGAHPRERSRDQLS